MLWLGVYAYTITSLTLPSFMEMLRQGGMTKENYRGITIPVGAGIILFFTGSVTILTTAPYFLGEYERDFLFYLFFLAGSCLLGFLDDAAGRGNEKGLRGHLSALIHSGRVTTGLLKAAGGLLLAFFVAYFAAAEGGSLIINIFLLALSLNTMNLLDLRPGRAAKFFLIVLACIGVWKGGRNEFFLCVPFAGALVAYLPFDLRGLAMLGDTGASLLGGILGWLFFRFLPEGDKIIIVMLLLALHLFTERYSLTRVIELIPTLAFLDRLGRSE